MYLVVNFVFIIVFLLLLWSSIKPRQFPKGPPWLPIIGNLLDFHRQLKQIGYHHLVWEELSKKYGPIVGLKMGRLLVVTVFGPDAVQEVLTRDEFDGRPDGFFFRLRTFGKRLGIVFSDGQFWQKQRKFSLQHLKNFGFGRKEMEEKVEEEVKYFISMLKKQCDRPILMHTIFDISVINVLWAMMAGERFDPDDDRLKKLLQIVHDAFKATDMSGGVLNQLPFLRFIAPKAIGYDLIINVLKRMWAFLEETISKHKETLCNASYARDLIDAFLQKMQVRYDLTFTGNFSINENNCLFVGNEIISDDQLLSLCLDLFMAGSETTSNTLGFSVIYMIEFPDVQKKVQKEMDEIVGRNRWPTLHDRINMKYTEAVLMEIQRCANVPPLGIAHRAVRKTYLLGYQIPKDTIILASLYSIHMDKSFWKDPHIFRPERFLNNGNIIINEKFFAPFGYGKRRCLGESLAKANYFLFFTSLLHNFTLERSKEGPYPQLQGSDGVTISPKPFKVKLKYRTD